MGEVKRRIIMDVRDEMPVLLGELQVLELGDLVPLHTTDVHRAVGMKRANLA